MPSCDGSSQSLSTTGNPIHTCSNGYLSQVEQEFLYRDVFSKNRVYIVVYIYNIGAGLVPWDLFPGNCGLKERIES